jgi:lactococcin 972 family bacteriocin
MLAAAVGLFAVGVAAPAFATTEYPEGGTWYYGVEWSENYSDYHHPDKFHGSSVENGNGLVRSDCELLRSWAYASQPATWWGNKAHYRFC